MFAPAGTPRDIITRLNGELRRIMADAEVRKQMTEIGVDAMYTTPEGLAELVRMTSPSGPGW